MKTERLTRQAIDRGDHTIDQILSMLRRVEKLERTLSKMRQVFSEQPHGPDCEPDDEWCECGKDDVLKALDLALKADE